MSQISGNTVIVPTLIAGNSGSLAFMPSGIPTASYQVTGSDLDAFIKATASFTIDALNNQFKITIPSASSGQQNDIIPFFITSSGINPRVGIGTTTPQSAFDFKDITDSTKGTELLLRSSRTTVGAEVGDAAGTINFAVDSGSFNSLETTGSIGKIKGIVTNSTADGVLGKISFELFKSNVLGQNVIEFGYGLGHIDNRFNAVFTSSIELKDLNSVGRSQFMMYDDTDALKFSILNGDVTASNNISASGDLHGNRLFLGPNNTAKIETSTGDNEFLFANRAHWRKSNAYISSRGNEWILSGKGISEPNNYTEAYVHIAKEEGTLKALSLDYSATGNKATFDIDTNGFLEIHPDGLSTYLIGSITASGAISASGDLTANTINGTINGGSF